MLAIVGGTSLLYSDLSEFHRREILSPFGSVEVMEGPAVLLQRHQRGLPPHRINHRANVAALAIMGVQKVVAISSVGSLRRGIKPGSMLIPDDYIALGDIPTIHDHAIVHSRPGISVALSEALGRIVPDAIRGGVYIQTRGPRIETVAEVRTFSKLADVVGMTLASEGTLASELGIEFTALCMVDNYANGIGEGILTYEHILEMSFRNRERTDAIVRRIIRELGDDRGG
ncbi:MAG: MTAP family purine nucleoside phosphorylase [Methanomicrobiales archaeon]|nr:MTAP family purine nucleoside phosphorylase [Methanomicrobiales archaeon]